MCGICGYISKRELNDDILTEMRDTMTHRGPDDAGLWQGHSEDGYVGLAHRRLSIFDLSKLGHQPMVCDDGNYVIAYNGEVYNFKEIRDSLIKCGYSFSSECDTEVVLKSYICWKEQCFLHFNGMFAISIWDKKRNSLILARDRMGVKPLYYYFNPLSGDFVFSSELKPIMKYPGFKKNIRTDMLGNFLCNKYIASPNTIFEKTWKLSPGSYLVFSNNKITISKYWDLIGEKIISEKKISSNFNDCKLNLDEILNSAVKTRLVADVPVGTFLSGGIDSALITAIAQKHSSVPIKTFSIGFYEKERDEADRARSIAKYLGTNHTGLYIGDKEIYNMISDIVRYYDEPFADSSQIPTMLVSQFAKKDVTVALSGDGGDELFCGYNMYDLVYIAQKTDFIRKVLHHTPILGSVAGRLSPEIRAFINNKEDYKTQLFVDVMWEEVKKILKDYQANPKHSVEEIISQKNWQEQRMLLDMCTYLPDEIMAKTDRASMKYSLEVRSPFLDYKVVENSFIIPHQYKYYRREKKYILKQLAYDYIPKELLSGPKRGFGVPLAKWLRGPLKKEIKRYSDPLFLYKQGLFEPLGIQELIKKQEKSSKIIYSSILWSFYMFQRWWEEYINVPYT